MSVRQLFRSELPTGANYTSVLKTDSPIRLHSNESPWSPFDGDTLQLNRYPEKQPADLVNRIAEIYEVAPAQLLITRGADDGIDLLVRGFCRPGNDAIIQCPPTFVMYQFFARLHGQQIVNVPLDERFELNDDEVIGKLNQSSESPSPVKLVFVCSPNNPTGNVMDRDAIVRIAKAADEKAIVVVDEAYLEFANRVSATQMIAEFPNVVVLRTLSKAYGLAGARLGIVIASEEVTLYLNQVLPPFPLSRNSIDVALQATAQDRSGIVDARIQETIQRRKQFELELQAMPFVQEVFRSDSNFLLVRVDDAQTVLNHCREQNVLVRDQSMQPGLNECLRISIGSEEEMNRLLATLRTLEMKS